MKILFDIRPLQTHSKFRGIGVYVSNLLKNLLKLDNENIYHLWGYKNLPLPEFLSEYNNIEISFIRGGTEFQRLRQMVTETIKLNIQLFKIKPDVIHFHMQMNPFTFHKSITTCHDTIPFIFRSEYMDNFFKWLKWNLHRLSVKQSDLILTISETSKVDIFRYYHINKDKIVVIYNGLPEVFRKYDDNMTEDILKKYGLEDVKYILYVGASDTRKMYQIWQKFITMGFLKSFLILNSYGLVMKDIIMTPLIYGKDKNLNRC
jgi:glycosyltransferase involved in cell wall biosynthesis